VRIVQELAGTYTFWANMPPWCGGTRLLVSGSPFAYDGSYKGTAAPAVPALNIVNGQNAGGAYLDVVPSRLYTTADPPAYAEVVGLSTYVKPWVAGRVQPAVWPPVNGPIAIASNVGQQTFVCTRYGVGNFRDHVPRSASVGQLPVGARHGQPPWVCDLQLGDSRRFGLYFYAPNGASADPEVEFSFMTVP
jgi:hypothetical protein